LVLVRTADAPDGCMNTSREVDMGSSNKLALIAAALASLAAAGCSEPTQRTAAFESHGSPDGVDKEAEATPKAEGFAIESASFVNGARIAREYTRDGDNHVPPLAWKGAPAGTKSFALEVVDPDAPTGTFAHWLVWDIPASAEHVDVSHAVQGKNDAGRFGWSGPEPPEGSGTHHYVFRLYALDVPSLPLDEKASRGELDAAMQGHVIATTEITGLYGE
jgi:Raf kinase inhibitor-like YbhB/YbcL family protein